MKIEKLHVEEFKGKNKITKNNKHLLGITNSDKKDDILFDRFSSADEYEAGGDELAAKEVSTSNPDSLDEIIGFIDKENISNKYDKANNELVRYIPNEDMKSGNELITYFKPKGGIEYYKKLLDTYYKSELK